MPDAGHPLLILLAEDDEDDYLLTKEALAEAAVPATLHRVRTGDELLDWVRHAVHDPGPQHPRPDLILLDLNMPGRSGHEALEDLKRDPDLATIPVVILTTSEADRDVAASYQLGAHSYIHKPVSFDAFVEAIKVLGRYWGEVTRPQV